MDAGRLKRYYLGGLTPDEEDQLEAQYFEDADLFAELMAAQDDLVRAYVRDELPPPDRDAFERHFLAKPAGRRKVRLTRTLLDAVEEIDRQTSPAPAQPQPASRAGGWSGWFTLPGSPHWRWATAAAAVVVLIVSGALVLEHWRLRARLEHASAEIDALTQQEQRARQASEAERARADRLDEELRRRRQAVESYPTAAGLIVAASLAPGVARAAEGARTVAIARGASIVLLELGLEAPAPDSYRIVIQAPDGREVWRQDAAAAGLGKPSDTVIVAVAASTFDSGEHTVRLERRTSSGNLETIHTYHFRVARAAR